MRKIGVFCASSNEMDAIYYEQAEALGKWMGETGKTLVYGLTYSPSTYSSTKKDATM